MKKSIIVKFLLIAAFVVAGLVSTYAQTRETVVLATRYKWSNVKQEYVEVAQNENPNITIIYEGKMVTFTSETNQWLLTTSDNETTYLKDGVMNSWKAYHNIFGNVTFYMTHYYGRKYGAVSIVYTANGSKQMLTYIVEL